MSTLTATVPDGKGHCFRGHIHTTYDHLREVLGKKHKKLDDYYANWLTEAFDVYSPAEVRDFKNCTTWHVGGELPNALDAAVELIKVKHYSTSRTCECSMCPADSDCPDCRAARAAQAARDEAREEARAAKAAKVIQGDFGGNQSQDREPSGASTFDTDDASSAEYFATTRGHWARYDHRRGRWLVWNTVRWAPDLDEEITRMVIDMARERIQQSHDAARIKKLAGYLMRHKVEDVKALARALKPLSTVGDEWDVNPWLLGVRNGVVDLHSGTVRKGRSSDMITMQAAANFDPEASCPLWEKTLLDIFDGDAQVVSYVQRALGYSLTGDCREEVFFLLTGRLDELKKNGRNGKGTIVNTVATVLGDYAADLSFHSLETNSNSDTGGASPDLAKLVHKRFVTASETSGGRFNEGRIKKMTGRDPITCRFLHQNEFTYIPEFKLWLSVNNPPKVRDTSLGFWARPHVIEFPKTFADNPDKTLKDRLLNEADGILAWLVRGCLDWQQEGLNPPASVPKAVLTYQAREDGLAEFIEDWCELDAKAQMETERLRSAYNAWCDERRWYGASRLGPKQFSQALRKRFGEAHRKDGKGPMCVSGIRLHTAADENPQTSS